MKADTYFLEKHVVKKHRFSERGDIDGRVSKLWFLLPIVIIVAGCILCSTLMGNDFSHVGYWEVQHRLFLSLNGLMSYLPDGFWANVTLLGDASVLLPLVFLLTLKIRQAWAAVISAIPLAVFSSVLGKKLAAMPRPAAVIDTGDFSIIGAVLSGSNSLPSGHTITVFAAVSAVLVALFPHVKTRKETACIALLLVLSGIVGLSRIAVGAHWPLDIVFGAGIGVLAGIGGAMMASRKYLYDYSSIAGQNIALMLLIVFSGSLIYRVISNPEPALVLWVAAIAGSISMLHVLLEEKVTIKVVVFRN